MNGTTNTETIYVILTGGTIDSYEISKNKSSVAHYLSNIKLHITFVFNEIFHKSSDFITIDDRKKIINEIQNTKHKHVLITHGTNTIIDTANYIKKNLVNNDKVIILTGAFVPLYFSPISDAIFNLGFSISKFKHSSPGVYICMNGMTFDPENVKKNYDKKIFEYVGSPERETPPGREGPT
jgi:L-asparaginase